MGRVNLAPVGERPQDDGGAREGEDEAVEDAGRPRLVQAAADGGDRERGEAHLQRAAQGHLAKDVGQALQRELETDGEEQHHHADLGEGLDGADGADQAQAIGAHQGAGREQAGNGGQPQLGQQDRDHHAQHGNNCQLVQ